MKHTKQGFVLIFVGLLVGLIAVMIFSLNRIISWNANKVGLYKDSLNAYDFNRQAIFDTTKGALGMILAIEATVVNMQNQTLENLSLTDRNNLVFDALFTPDCTKSTARIGDFKSVPGLCNLNVYSTKNMNVSIANLLLPSNASFKAPCGLASSGNGGSYRLSKVVAGSNSYPLLDDNSGKYSIQYPIGNKNACANPRYAIQILNSDFNIEGVVNHARLYEVTSKAFGQTATTQSLITAYFYVKCSVRQNGGISDADTTSCYPNLLSFNVVK